MRPCAQFVRYREENHREDQDLGRFSHLNLHKLVSSPAKAAIFIITRIKN